MHSFVHTRTKLSLLGYLALNSNLFYYAKNMLSNLNISYFTFNFVIFYTYAKLYLRQLNSCKENIDNCEHRLTVANTAFEIIWYRKFRPKAINVTKKREIFM